MLLLYLLLLYIKTFHLSVLNIQFVSVIAKVFPVLFDQVFLPALFYPFTLFTFHVPILYIILFSFCLWIIFLRSPLHWLIVIFFFVSFESSSFMLFPLIFLFSRSTCIFYDDLLVTNLYSFAFSFLVLSDDSKFPLFVCLRFNFLLLLYGLIIYYHVSILRYFSFSCMLFVHFIVWCY